MAAPKTFDIADRVVLQATFKNRAGALANPDSVVITVLQPSGVKLTPAVATPSTGVYESEIDIAEVGEHWWRAAGTGAVKAAAEGRFLVQDRRVS